MIDLIGDHPFYKKPAPDQTLWRYMDFVNLFALLDSQALFFPSAATLQASDPFEGSISRITQANRKKMLDKMVSDLTGGENSENSIHEATVRRQMEAYQRTRSDHLKLESKWTFISCWHMNDGESAAMWKLYSTNAHSVAIRTTFEKLRSSLVIAPEFQVIASGVNYIDYAAQPVIESFSMAPFFHKRRSFEHEKEFRIVAQELPLVPNQGAENSYRIDKGRVAPAGIPVQADLQQMIQCVYVSPDAPYWVLHLVHRLLEKYEVGCAMRGSTLLADVIY